MIRVLVVDDHDIVRFGISSFLETMPDITVIGEASNGQEAVVKALELSPDVILMDLLMPIKSGVEALAALQEAKSTSRVVVLTSSVDDKSVLDAVRAGALSYVLKTTSAAKLADIIRRAAAGEPTLDADVQKIILGQVKGTKPALWTELTDRELAVLRLIATGYSNQEIADALGIGIKTVKTHVSNIFIKLDVQDRTQAAIYAIRHQLAE
jgi:two-component system, NarL family, response regulator LiaR